MPKHKVDGLPDDVPVHFRRSVAGFSFSPAARVEAAKFEHPIFVSSSHPMGVASAAWAAVSEKSKAVRDAIRSHDGSAADDAKSET